MAQLKRSELIDEAHRKLGVLDGTGINPEWQLRGIRSLNAIIREESQRSARVNEMMYQSISKTIRMIANRTGHATGFNLPDDIEDVTSVVFRDASGDDTPLELMNEKSYNTIEDKNKAGDPTHAFLRKYKDRTSQLLYVWPYLTSVTTPSSVVGTDGLYYFCTQEHTAINGNRPISGKDWEPFWSEDPTISPEPSAWALSTAYTSGEMLSIVYRRALAEMTNQTDNPDMPDGWDRYLTYRLAHELAPHFYISLEERQWLRGEFMEAREALLPGTQPTNSAHHDKGTFF